MTGHISECFFRLPQYIDLSQYETAEINVAFYDDLMVKISLVTDGVNYIFMAKWPLQHFVESLPLLLLPARRANPNIAFQVHNLWVKIPRLDLRATHDPTLRIRATDDLILNCLVVVEAGMLVVADCQFDLRAIFNSLHVTWRDNETGPEYPHAPMLSRNPPPHS